MNALDRAASLDAIEEAAHKVGRVPRRRFGNSRREISVLVGAGTWGPEAIEAGVRCGINYWHKAERWNTPPAILKNREAYYCEVCVDRVRGSHETGEIDEEAHCQFVKRAVERTGLRYFDDFLFHFGYHTVAELKNNRGPIRAFERLRKEGLVRHLCISQHNYNGNPKVPGGEAAPAVLTAVIEDGLYEHAQFFFSYGDDPAVYDLVNLAKRKGFGTIGMKTARGIGRLLQDREFMKNLPAGISPYNALARWLTTRTQLDAAVIQITDLNQFVDTYAGAGKAMRAADLSAIERMTAYANREVCRLCNECMGHCEQQVPIAEILRYERYARDYGEEELARRLYAELEKRGNACTACGACLLHCPLGLRIPEKLAEAHRHLG